MAKFQIKKRKLRKFWEKLRKNFSDIEIKNNQKSLDFFNTKLSKDHTLKTPKKLYDSNNEQEIFLTPNTSFHGGDLKSAIKGSKLPTLIEYTEDIDLTIPEHFLPFIEFSVEIESVPNTDLAFVSEYQTSEHSGDNIEVRGDGTLIYKGDPEVEDSVDTIFSESYLSENSISQLLTKKAWQASIIKTDDSEVAGKVISISITQDNGTGCNGNPNTTSFSISHLTDGNHEIKELSPTSVTAIGDETISTWTDPGSGCQENLVINSNVERTFSLVDNDFNLQVGATLLTKSDIKTPIENNQTYTFVGRWLFYSTLRQKLFATTSGGPDGDFTEITLTNLPNTDDGDTLPYTTITLTRNLVEQPNEITFSSTFITSTERQFKHFIRLSKSTDTEEKFRYRLHGEFLLISPSNIENPDTTDFPVYDDKYTVVGSGYNRTTTDHTILSKTTYFPDTQDVKINIKAYLTNPLYWKENRIYFSNDV